MDSEVIGAYIAAGASLVGALLTALFALSGERKRQDHERRMESLRSQLESDVKRVEAHLSDQNSERSARRDYEYEARKRLYEEVEPVLFQLVELSEAALHRIFSLARTARHGNLSDPKSTWLLSDKEYYYRSTLYNLLAPMAAVKLLQRCITFVDLSVEKSIAAEYNLAKRLLITFTDDFDFAQCHPALTYDPHNDELETQKGKTLLQNSPAIYWKQGVVVGDVEIAVECLLTESIEGRTARVKSYAEFEGEMDMQNSILGKAMRAIRYLFLRFHPERRPILWRLLVAQACVYHSFLQLRESKLAGRNPSEKPLTLIPVEERARMDWRQKSSKTSDLEVLETPFQAAAQYFQKHAPRLFDYGAQ